MRFKLPIGDWSGDGHEKCDYYIVDSNVDFKKIVRAYIDMDRKYEISKQVSEYEDCELTEDFIDLLENLRFDIRKYCISRVDRIIESDDLAELIIDLIMFYDNSIELKIVSEDMPMLCNWTAPKGEHLDLPGYGLFE